MQGSKLNCYTAHAEAQLASTQPVVELEQSVNRWPVPDPCMNFDVQQPYINNQERPCSPAIGSSHESLHNFEFEQSLMQEALEDW